MRFGKPLDFSRYYGLETDRMVLRAVTDEIMYELMKLSGQEYVDEYAPRGKSRLPSLRLGHHPPPGGTDPDGGEPDGTPPANGTVNGSAADTPHPAAPTIPTDPTA